MISAKEARKLSKRSIDSYLGEVEELIKTASAEGSCSIILRSDLFTREAYNGSPTYKQVVKVIEDLGYTVKFFYEERQFVDMYTIISW